MKKVTIQTPLQNFNDNWGGTYHDGEAQPFPEEVTLRDGQEWGHLRGQIEEKIKQKVASIEAGKFGAVLVTTDPITLVVTIRFFASENDRELWQSDSETYADLVIDSETFQGSMAPSGYTLAVNVRRSPAIAQVAGATNNFVFSYNSYWGGDTSDLDPNQGTAVLKVNGGVMEEISLTSGGNIYSLNVGKYCLLDSNTVEIIVSNTHGKSRTWNYLIEAMTLNISLEQSYLNLQHIAKTYNWELPVRVSGIGGTVYIRVDENSPITRAVSGNTSATFMIDTNNTLTTGAHNLEIWCVNSTYNLETEHLFTQFIKAGNNVVLALGTNPAKEMTIYGEVDIPYYFYYPNKPAGEEVEVTINLYDGSGNVVNNVIQDVVMGESYSSGMQEAKVHLMDNVYIGQTMRLIISIGSVNVQHEIKVNAAGITLQEASECKVYYELGSKANADHDVASNNLESYYNNQRTSRLKRSDNFRLNSENGFHNGGCIIPANRKLTLFDWQPFAIDFGANGTQTGKTIEMELSVDISVNQDIPVVSCMDTKCGFEVFPNRVEVKHGSSDRIISYFPDGERVKFSLVINGTTTHCVNDDGNGNVEVSDRNLGFIYMNGVMVRIFEYGNDTWNQITVKNIEFGSIDGRTKVCSFRGYDKALSMREILDNFAYDTPVLADKLAIATRNNILQLDGETIDRNKISAALPNTPIITWFMERLPANKKDPQTCKETVFLNPEWDDAKGHACAPFTAGEHEINGDGTSSNAYPLPYKNWAEKFSGFTLHLTSGDLEVNKYSITYGVDDAEKKFVHKVNYASSEGIFNILAMNMYQQLTLATKSQISDLLSKQQQSQDNIGDDITFRKSLSGFPEIGFRKHTVNGMVVTEFLSIYNFINNKKTGSMFGMVNDYKKNQLWEIDENRNFFLVPMTENTVEGGQLVPSNGVRENEPLYYARFPAESPVNTDNDLGICTKMSEITQANNEIKALRNIHNWIYSINPNVAKRYKARYGNYRPFTIAEDGFTSKTYAGITFTTDTEQYRAQKFLDEYQDHLHINDCIFYFLFCTWILGKDSMDKNMSLFLDDVEDFYSDYPEISSQAKVKLRIMLRDTDTTNMFNNTGRLAFKYWHEWNDTYNPVTGETGEILGESWNGNSYDIISSVAGGEPVFNGRLSGLWDAISQFIPGQVKSVYDKMRTAGLNFNSMFTMYQNFRNYWCEALYNVDGLGYANTGNLDMAYGDKLLLSKYFYKYRERYMDSKYGVADPSKQVTMRLYGVPTGVWMKHYTPMYASYNFGVGEPVVARSINVGTAVLLPCNSESFSDATCYVNDADMVTEIGFYTMSGNTPVLHGLEGLRDFCFTLNFERFTRLTKFIWANAQGEENENTHQTMEQSHMDFSGMKMLRELVMTYCSMWQGNPVIGSDVIEKIDFRGTPISHITIPETETLTTLHLPSTLTELNLKNLPNLATFSIQGIEDLVSVNIENTPLVSEAIAAELIALIESGVTPALTSGQLTVSSISNANYWKLMDAFGAEVFDPENELYIEVPAGVYIRATKPVFEAGQSQTIQAISMPIDDSTTIEYQLIENGEVVTPVAGIATSAGGSTLNVSTGMLTSVSGVTETYEVRAKATTGVDVVYSDNLTINVNVYTYPTAISINGDFWQWEEGIYNYIRVTTGTFNADVDRVEWSLTDAGGGVQINSSTSSSCSLEILSVSAAEIKPTLTCKVIFTTGYEMTATLKLLIQNMSLRAVDLGLPSGTKWANMNLGANSVVGHGLYHAWGETTGYADAAARNTALGLTGGFDSAAYQATGASAITANLALSEDAAHATLGGSWRMPSKEDFAELNNNCDHAWRSIKGVNGMLFTSRINGNFVFFPASGHFNGTSLDIRGSYGYYWSSSFSSASYACYMLFNSGSVNPQSSYYRFHGLSVRAVQ